MDIETRKAILFQINCCKKIKSFFWVDKNLVIALEALGDYGLIIKKYLNGSIIINDRNNLAVRLGAIRKELEGYLASVIVGYVAGYITTIDPTTHEIIHLCCQYERELDLPYTLAKERIVFDIAEHFSTFDHNGFYTNSIDARHAFDTYLFIDNKFQNDYDIKIFFESLKFQVNERKSYEIMDNLINKMKNIDSNFQGLNIDKVTLGLHSFLDFTYDLNELFKTIPNYPFLKSIIWCRYSYYFEFCQVELKYLCILLEIFHKEEKQNRTDDWIAAEAASVYNVEYYLEDALESYLANIKKGTKALRAMLDSRLGSHFMHFVNRGEAAVPVKT